MILSAIVATSGQFQVHNFVAAMSLSQDKVVKESVFATAHMATSVGQLVIDYDMDVNRDGTCSIQVKDPRVIGPQVRSFYRFGPSVGTCSNYRADLKQIVTYEGKPGSMAEVAKAVDPQFDMFVAMLVEREGLAAWFAELPVKGTWNWYDKGADIKLQLKQNDMLVEFVLRKADSRLTRMTAGRPDGAINWSLKYAKFRNLPDPVAIKGTYRVANFDTEQLTAKADKAAAKHLQRAYKYYDPGRSFAFTRIEGDTRTKVSYTPQAVRQEGDGVSWSLTQGELVVSAKSGTYSGPASPGRTVDAVAGAGSRVEPFLRSLVIGRNPVRFMLNDAYQVTVGGSGAVGSDTCTILKATSQYADLMVTCSDKDGFIYMIVARTKDQSGRVLADETSEFERLPGFPPTKVSTKGIKTKNIDALVD